MGIYDRDWWRERYNKRTAHNEQRDAEWRKPKQPPKQTNAEPERQSQIARQQPHGLRPSPIGPIIVWAVIFLTVFVTIRHILR